jgi:hypothetical protein
VPARRLTEFLRLVLRALPDDGERRGHLRRGAVRLVVQRGLQPLRQPLHARDLDHRLPGLRRARWREPVCAAGQCAFTCASGFNPCNGACASATDVTACGSSCTRCPAGHRTAHVDLPSFDGRPESERRPDVAARLLARSSRRPLNGADQHPATDS